MPEFKDIGRRSRQRLRTLDGRHFFGRISVLSESEGRAAGFYIPRRILNVAPECDIDPGTVVFSPEGRAMLLAWNGDLDHQGSYARTFKLYDLDRQVSWKRKVTTNDPVTSLPKNTSETELGPIWCALELLGQEENFQIPASKYRLISGAAVQLGDKIDDRLIVRRVESVLGITIAEVA